LAIFSPPRIFEAVQHFRIGIRMSYFEYKVVPAPTQRRWRQQSVDGMDKYASTVADLMTEMGLEGWDFIGAEALRERRRRFFVLICDIERTLMIFRRPAQIPDLLGKDEVPKDSEAAVPAEPVKPRRVARPDLIAEVAAGARKVQVNVVKRLDEDASASETTGKEVDETQTETAEPTGQAHMLERAVKTTKAATGVAAE
jgi:hypothetical protein